MKAREDVTNSKDSDSMTNLFEDEEAGDLVEEKREEPNADGGAASTVSAAEEENTPASFTVAKEIDSQDASEKSSARPEHADDSNVSEEPDQRREDESRLVETPEAEHYKTQEEGEEGENAEKSELQSLRGDDEHRQVSETDVPSTVSPVEENLNAVDSLPARERAEISLVLDDRGRVFQPTEAVEPEPQAAEVRDLAAAEEPPVAETSPEAKAGDHADGIASYLVPAVPALSTAMPAPVAKAVDDDVQLAVAANGLDTADVDGLEQPTPSHQVDAADQPRAAESGGEVDVDLLEKLPPSPVSISVNEQRNSAESGQVPVGGGSEQPEKMSQEYTVDAAAAAAYVNDVRKMAPPAAPQSLLSARDVFIEQQVIMYVASVRKNVARLLFTAS